jgi:hypothetical protein
MIGDRAYDSDPRLPIPRPCVKDRALTLSPGIALVEILCLSHQKRSTPSRVRNSFCTKEKLNVVQTTSFGVSPDRRGALLLFFATT